MSAASEPPCDASASAPASSSSGAAAADEVEEEPLDPRVQVELEKLNARTEEINQLETQLEEASAMFRTLLSDSTHQLKAMSKKLGNCIEKARPYYEAQEAYHKAQQECQSAATHYQRASGIHAAAKETIALAEQRFLSNQGDWQFDNAWQEMLNHATMKVMEAERQKTESEAVHLQKAASFQEAGAELQKLEKKLGKMIQKSQPYFEQKDVFNKALADQKRRVQQLQGKVAHSKAQYSRSLRNLEDISESIHAKRRRLKAGESVDDDDDEDDGRRMPWRRREPGVGAEVLASLPSFDLDACDVSSQCGGRGGSSSFDLASGDDERAAASGASSSAIGSIDLPQEDELSSQGEKTFLSLDDPLALTRSQSCPTENLLSLVALQTKDQLPLSRLQRQTALDDRAAPRDQLDGAANDDSAVGSVASDLEGIQL